MPKTCDRRNIENKKKFIGMCVVASNGQQMRCIDYKGVYDLTVQFEDGYVANHVYKCSFVRGTVKNPNKPCRNNNIAKARIAREKYIGMQVKATNGMNMTCVDYVDSHNITVKFDNGMTRTNVGVNEFLQGLVRENKVQRYVGMQTTSKNNGQMMECVEYFSSTNVTVKFDDGTIVYNKPISSFLNGTIKNPNVRRISKFKEDHTGETNITRQGYFVTVVEYKDAEDLTVQFNDGMTKKTTLAAFKRGAIGYPLSQDLKRPFRYNDYLAQFVFKNTDHAYYACKCTKCGFDDILSAKEMLEQHVCDFE